ncbi:undecaprenyl-diphosphate phosphatase [Natronogracilivirga saccharolytica]|uniref:Undecaprenyl-diphosphatase n=1 Tax=Natronogracilivirga saccharolytica TaxID=2812953 RepID=A0A8J7RJH5_9BACT|nr:undecaprenyl-diphosphate phosphatase [Natronogracilivirga saccharolytica]MBP3191313.1 undecaprenyl-diphosphate phosphatase [Natronogracilivirga saccharolytica]
MVLWVAIVLGIVQGIFMFFPVSSTSHLALAQHFFIWTGQDMPSPDSAEMILFDLIVHVGTLVSIAVVFRNSLAKFLRDAINGFLATLRMKPSSKDLLFVKLSLLGLFSVAVTGIIGYPMKSQFENVFAHPLLMSLTLVITGLLLWWTDILPERKIGLREIGFGVALVIGVGQGLALIPGFSRSGLTIAFALFAGLKRRWAAEYSFFIAFPTILGATLLQAMEVVGYGSKITIGFPALATGFIVSALVGIAALYLVVHMLYKAKFRFFSYYVWCLALGIIVSHLIL